MFPVGRASKASPQMLSDPQQAESQLTCSIRWTMGSEREKEAGEVSEEEGLTSCKDSKHGTNVTVIFLVAVSKYLTRSKLGKEGFVLTHSLMLQSTMMGEGMAAGL